MFTVYNRDYLCIVDYHTKFPYIKKTEDLSAHSLALSCTIIFLEYALPKKIMPDESGNFISDKFKRFCKNLNIEQAVSSSYNLQTNGQVEEYIKFIKHTIKNALILHLIYM